MHEGPDAPLLTFVGAALAHIAHLRCEQGGGGIQFGAVRSSKPTVWSAGSPSK
jgi:hypothetical protein